MHKAIIFRVFLFCIIIAGAACSFKSLYENTTDIPKGVWNKENVIQFNVPVLDTINSYNIILSIRNNNLYPFSNIYILSDTYSPKGNVVRDTIQIELCDSHGKWYGKGIGGIWQNRIYYKKNIRFPVSGAYRFNFKQAMRNDDLEGIIDMGIKIERCSK